MKRELVGDPKSIEKLLAVEQRLGTKFPDAYRAFIADRKPYSVVKHIALRPVGRCDWLDDTKSAIAIGQSFTEEAGTLCFKVARGVVSEAVYLWDGSRFKRIPDFGELVWRERTNPTLTSDARVRLAERLGGAARRCACGGELRVLQVCTCGRIGARSDPPYVLSDAEQQEAQRAFPTLVRASRIVTALKEGGHAVPSGPTQLLATADLLEARATASALLAAWKKTGMKLDLDEPTLARVLKKVR
ncbi:MAG: SMI1/KNR4 family protein [Deltaproteobacteria bacterium]|nr:SMI1/KNR4 family protein [Deltaproteobacteria bacterium]